MLVGVREYELVVGGELSDDAAPAFEGMRLERRDGTTILVGHIRDQAALQGVSDADLGSRAHASEREEPRRSDVAGLRPGADVNSDCASTSLTSFQRTVSA